MLESTAEEQLPQSARAPRAACRSVLMVGTDASGKGGISTVINGYADGGLFDRFTVEYVVTHRNGSAWEKITTALRGWAKVASALRRLDAPLVHIQTASHASFWRKFVVCLMAWLAGRPYILHIHGGGFLHFYEKSGRLARRCIRSALANADLVLTLSEPWRERLQKICPAARVEVLSNAVPLPSAQDLLPASKREHTVLFLGDISRAKGVSDLVRAFALANDGYRLVFGGTGATGDLLRLARSLHVGEAVECPGWMSGEHKRSALARAALFVLPSYAEGMPMAVLEAMSWGLPVIATPVGALPQLIQHERNGLLVPAGDIAALSQALARLMQDPRLRDRLGAAARATVEARYTPDAMLSTLGQIYNRFGIQARGVVR